MKTKTLTVDDYIASFPKETQIHLKQLRAIIKKTAPKAEEIISYNMPAYKQNGILVYFAAYKQHIGFYATPTGHSQFEVELSKYKQGKGSVQFPLNEPLPLTLIKNIVAFRVDENSKKMALKKNLKICAKGHKFYKSSDCPTCPICEKKSKINENVFSVLAAPAIRALNNKGITNLIQLSNYTENEILQLHGMGKSSIPLLKKELVSNRLSFKKEISVAKNTKPSNSAEVESFMKNLKHPMKKEVEALRQIILKTDKKIGEEIFWKAPTFFYTGPMKPFNPKEYKRVILVFNLFKKDCLRLIFLNGAKVGDSSGLLEGDYKDGRRLAMFYNLKDIERKEKYLNQILKKYLTLLKE